MSEQASNWDDCLEYSALTDVGLRRANNQDSMAVVLAGSEETWRQRGHLFIVADGMGAHAAGELASKLATDTVPHSFHKLTELPPHEALLAAIRDANTRIHSRGQASEDFRGMGTTVTALVLLPAGALVAHVGDSRAYRWRANRLEQLTFDHSLVWEMRAARQIPEEEVPSFIPKNVITRSLGPDSHVQVDLEGPFPVEVGDAFLLCSDGLSGPLEDTEIGKVLGCLPPDQAVRSLVDLANLRGGPDNITAIVARVTGPELAGGGDSEAERPGSKPANRGPVHPVVWTLMGVFALGALGLGALGQPIPALMSLAAAVAAAVAGLVQRFGGGRPGQESDGQRLGKGPHSVFDCTPDADFVDRLLQMNQELRDAATSEDWPVDWDRFNAHHDRAVAAANRGDEAEAVRQHCHAISFMMEELRNRRPRRDPDDTDVLDSFF